jgi:hypothetical protein
MVWAFPRGFVSASRITIFVRFSLDGYLAIDWGPRGYGFHFKAWLATVVQPPLPSHCIQSTETGFFLDLRYQTSWRSLT